MDLSVLGYDQSHLLQRSHPACWGHQGSSHFSPALPYDLFYRDASSALLYIVNRSMVELNYSRSRAFRCV